ncbi:MAG: glycosyltransferase family 39 protein [Acidimicrobiia bacterium]|nr:glycosyltransferase family 39 protein [Acidimicrobiia bacterium]
MGGNTFGRVVAVVFCRQALQLSIDCAVVARAAPKPDSAFDTSGTFLVGPAPSCLSPLRVPTVGAVLAVIGGLVLRFVAPSPLWLDEALSVNIALLDFAQLVEALRHDGHPLLYYWLLGDWIDIFGESDFAVRSLSGIFSVLCIPMLYKTAQRYGPAVAKTTLLLATSSPFLLRYATEVRMYSLLTLLCCVGWLCVERAIERPTIGRLCLVSLVVAALVHTHYWSIWLVAAALIVVGYNIVFGSGGNRGVALRVGAAIIVGASTLLVWLGVLLEQLRTTGTPWAGRARPAEVVVETIQAIGGSSRFEGELLGVALMFLAMLGVFIHRADGREVVLRFSWLDFDRAAICVLATLGTGGMVAFVVDGAFEPRYASVVVGFVLVLAANGIAMLPPRVGLGVLAFVVLFGFAVAVDEARRDRTQGAEVAARIDETIQSGDSVVFCPDQVGPATRRALLGADSFFAYPRGDGILVDWQNYAATIAESPVGEFVSNVLVETRSNDVYLVRGLGYKGFDDRCEAVHAGFAETRETVEVVVPAGVFEPMALTRFEARS